MEDKELMERAAALRPVYGKRLWGKYRRAMREHIAGENMNAMLTWSTITATMYVKRGDVVDVASDYLFSDNESKHRWEKAVVDPGFGFGRENAGEYTIDGASSNLIHQAYYIKRWEEHTGKKVEELDSIVEYGGGYGAMAYLCHKLGFIGEYTIYDFPVMSLLQEYYLSKMGIKSVRFTSDPFDFSSDLFISLWGIGEAPLQDRKWVPGRIRARHNLAVYISKWEGIDNVEWFKENFNGAREISNLSHIAGGLSLLMS